MPTKAYKQIFSLSVKLILNFARIGKQPNLEDFKKFLQGQGIHMVELKGKLFIVDKYNEVVARISPHPLGGFEIADMSPQRFSEGLG
jgi:hypothetical protein